MTDVWYFLNDRVTYHSSYDTKISYGNTSTGELKVEYLGGCMSDLKHLVEEGFRVHPVVTLGSDLFGKITWEKLKRSGCVMDEAAWSGRRTPFVFRLSNREWREDVCYQFQADGADTEICGFQSFLYDHPKRPVIIPDEIASLLNLDENTYIRCRNSVGGVIWRNLL